MRINLPIFWGTGFSGGPYFLPGPGHFHFVQQHRDKNTFWGDVRPGGNSYVLFLFIFRVVLFIVRGCISDLSQHFRGLQGPHDEDAIARRKVLGHYKKHFVSVPHIRHAFEIRPATPPDTPNQC